MSAAVTGEHHATRDMRAFVAGLRYEAVPPEVIARMKLLMLDALGCGLYAAPLEWSAILQRSLAAIDATQGCTVWGTGLKLSAPHAALVNGSQVQGFELDDAHRLAILHTGSVVLPALVAIAELHPGLSGREFLAAAVAGYEVGPRVGLCMGSAHLAQGWHPAATVGVFAAAATAARALKLDAERTMHALGIAGTQSCGLMAAQFGAMVKRMHAGRASQSGVYSGLIAASGFTGILDVFETEYGGFCTTFSRSHDRYDLAQLTAGFGETWQAMGVRLKFYACVGSNHSTLDALRELRAEHRFGVADVDRIVVHGSEASVEHVGWKYEPQGMTAAQLNLSYCVATLLIDGEVFVDQFADDKLADPARLALAGRVEMRHDPEITARGGKFRQMVRVEVHLRDGTRLTRTLETSRRKETFASPDEVVGKFETLARHVLPRSQVEQLRDLMLKLEDVADTAELGKLLRRA